MSITENLKSLECPINWNLESALLASIESDSSRTLEQAKELVKKNTLIKIGCPGNAHNTDGSAALQKCSQYLTISWVQYADSPECMKRYLEDADDFVAVAVSEIDLLTRYAKAVKYLFDAMWAHLFDKERNLDKAQESLDSLTPFDALEDKDRAAIFALKSCVFMELGPAGHDGALSAINKTLELEDIAEWHFLKGKCLARYRRTLDYKSVPSDEELFHLRKAVEMKQASPSHYVFCGQSVMEYALYSRAARSNTTVEDAHMDECEELMVVAALLNNDSPVILIRIAKGLMHMKGKRGFELLEHCVRRSLELLPESGLGNHVAGNFYMYRNWNPKLAIFHLKKAALDHKIFGAFINLIDVVYKTCTETNIELLVEEFWEYFREQALCRVIAAGLMASYHFFLKDDILKSIAFWRMVLQSRDIRVVKRVYNFFEVPDLTVLLVGEAQHRLRTHSNLSSNEEDALRSFLLEVLEARPRLDIARTMVTREEFITKALARMSPERKLAISSKLHVNFASANAYRIPARRVERQERVLPLNWRQP